MFSAASRHKLKFHGPVACDSETDFLSIPSYSSGTRLKRVVFYSLAISESGR